jgi:DNA-binding transcriptional LysR family regulator
MQPGLHLNNLKYFYDAVETMSISEAARKNFITQSAVSQGIQKLEKALAISLITHQRNHFKLTPEGQIIFSLAQQLFATLKAMLDVACEQKAVVSGQINIACTQSIAVNLISTVLQTMKEDYPEVSMKLKVAKMDNICMMLKRGLMDLGIVVESEICDQFDKLVVRKGHFQLYAKNANKNSVHEGVYVDHSNGLYVDRLSEMYRKRFKKELVVLQELDSWQVLAKCAENGIGCCFLPDFVLAKNSTIKPIEQLAPIPYTIVAISPQGVHLTRAAKAFLSLFA